MSVPRSLLVLALLVGLAAYASAEEKKRNLLVIGQSKGYQHEAISTAMVTLYNLGRSSGEWNTYFRTDCAAITKKPLKYGAKNLNDFDAIVFFTDGNLDMDDSQKADFLSFIHDDGKGFIGIHSATITFTGWPAYGEMIGGYFDGHPWGVFDAPLVVEDPTFPGMSGLPKRFTLKDEIYQIKDFSRENVRVLLRLDASKVDLSRKGVHRTDGDFAVAWARNYGKGRVAYNGLGHNTEVWDRPEIQKMWLETVRWSLGTLPGDATPRPKPEESEVRSVGFIKVPGGLDIKIGHRPFASYRFEEGKTTRPFFKHLHDPNGTQVTRNSPPVDGVDATDHADFHPGLWMAFGDLDGADCWRNKDRVRHVAFVAEPAGGHGRGTFAVKNRYERAGNPICEEVARFTIAARPAGYFVLWDSEFRPLGRVFTFGDQEEMGLGVRVATPLSVVKGGEITNSDGLRNEANVWGKTADWCAYRGVMGGRRSDIVVIPHPGNFRRSWFHARDYGLLVANPFGRNAFTNAEKSKVVVKQGETLQLRFGVAILNGPSDGRPDFATVYRDYLVMAGDP